jgi:putative thioredoxin
MIEINDATGPGAVSRGNCILMFYTTWCPRCPPVLQKLADLEKKYSRNKTKKFTLYKIDFDQNPEAKAFFRIEGVPAILAVKDGAVLEGWVGIPAFHLCEQAVKTLFM